MKKDLIKKRDIVKKDISNREVTNKIVLGWTELRNKIPWQVILGSSHGLTQGDPLSPLFFLKIWKF